MNSQIWVMLKAKIHPGRELPVIMDGWIKKYRQRQVASKAPERANTSV